MPLTLDEARQEVATRTLDQIQEDTAISWTHRAIAAYEFAHGSTNTRSRLKWLLTARELEHEALEHAALVADHVLPTVREALAPWKTIFANLP